MTTTWVMVANSSTARFFEVEKDGSLKEFELVEHPESRMYARDLVSDRPGRSFESATVARHAIEPTTSPKEVEFNHFAKQLTEILNSAHQEGKFKRLYIVASPHFLGLLRPLIKSSTAQALTAEIDKDMTQLSAQEIRKQLPY